MRSIAFPFRLLAGPALSVPLLFAQEPAARPPSPVEQAFAELEASPRDAWLQFQVLQLARRAGQLEQYGIMARRLARPEDARTIDTFDLFTGALAVQESLQLDWLRAAASEPIQASTVPIATLAGPTVKSHPWQQLLAGRRPEVSPMAKLVPADFWFAEFASLQKLLALADRGDLWGSHFVQQAVHEATALDFGERLRRQLAIETTPILRPFYDQVVARIALTGSDAYLREGTDLTLLFSLRQPELFRARMQSFLKDALLLPGARSERFELGGIAVEHVATADRRVHVFAADPAKDLHVRSNSREALARVLAAIQGKDAAGGAVPRLGDTDEMLYVRTLMPAGAPEEDGFVYLSDPFVRRIVGPQVKLAERRRLQCSAFLRMVGHGALLHRIEHGADAESLAALIAARSLPEGFGAGNLGCPEGGELSLAEDHQSGRCSRHGQLGALVPCLELQLREVTPSEARTYQDFVRGYSDYWRTFFDPIVLRIAVTPARHRVETLILPLIDNTIYTRMAQLLGGAPAPLGDAPRSERCLLMLGAKIDKRPLLADAGGSIRDLERLLGPGVARADVQRLLEFGIGDRITLQVCDQEPMFDFSVPEFFSFMFDWFGTGVGFDEFAWASLITSLNAPVVATVDVLDEVLVDGFLAQLDEALAQKARNNPDAGTFLVTDLDFYRLGGDAGPAIRCARIGAGPFGFRLFWTRIDKHVVVASRKNVLEELLRAPRQPAPAVAASTGHAQSGHALLTLRPQAWNAVRPDYELGWAENARKACLANLGPLGNLLRAVPAAERSDPTALRARLDALAFTVYGARFYCPDGGEYVPDGERTCRCTLHGTPRAPVQGNAPANDSEIGRMLRGFRGASMTLTFLPEGLRAVVEIEQK